MHCGCGPVSTARAVRPVAPRAPHNPLHPPLARFTPRPRCHHVVFLGDIKREPPDPERKVFPAGNARGSPRDKHVIKRVVSGCFRFASALALCTCVLCDDDSRSKCCDSFPHSCYNAGHVFMLINHAVLHRALFPGALVRVTWSCPNLRHFTLL